MATDMRRRPLRRRTSFSSTLCSSLVISLFCILTSDATFFFKKDHQEPEYAHHPIPDEESLSLDPPTDGECYCECPKNKIIRVEVPKTQVQYFPIDEKELEDSHQTIRGLQNSMDQYNAITGGEETPGEYSLQKPAQEEYQEFEGPAFAPETSGDAAPETNSMAYPAEGTSGDSGGQQYHPAAATEPPASHRTPSHGKDSKRTTQEQHSRPHAGSEKQRPKLATVTVIKEQYDVHSDEDDEDKKAGDAAGPYKTSGRAPASLSGYAPISSSRPSGRPADVTTYQDTSGQAFHTRSGTEYESASTTGNQVSRGSRRGTTPAAGKTTPRSVRSEKRSNYLLVLRPVHSPDTREERVGPTTGVTSRTSSVTPPARSYEEAVGSSAGAIVTGRPLAANAKVLRNLKQLEDMALELKENLIKQGVKQMKQMTTRRRSRAGVRYEMMQPPVYHSIITSKEQDKNEISKMASGADVQRKTAFAPETSGHRHRIRPNSHSPQESRKQLLKSASHLTMKQAPQVPDDDDDDEYGDPVETDILSNTSGQRASSLQGMEKDHLMTTPHAITNNQTPQSNAQPVRSFVKIRYQATGRETSHENTHRDSTKSLNSSNARHTIRSSSIMEPFSPDYQ